VHSATAKPAATAAAAASTDPLSAVYQSICTILKDGGSQSDVTAVVKSDLASANIPGYTAQDLVSSAEKADCPQYLAVPVATAPAMTASQQQAVTSAQGYLTDGQGFSYSGLVKQLTSQYGNGFSQADATFAVNYLHPDWDAQAVTAAKGYLADGQGFSRASLLQQLTSSYGDGFTQAQGEYAVAHTMG
jgi:small ligand-binding sensory domain FIST